VAEIVYPKLVDGQPLDAASLNDRFTVGGGSLQGAVNDLTPDATSPGTFNSNHLPSMVVAFANQSIGSETAMITIDHAVVPWPTNAVLTLLGTDLQVEPSAGVSYNLSTGECQGVLVMADLYVFKIRDGTQADPNKFYARDALVCMLEVREAGAGPWVPILRTVRWVHSGFFNTNDSGTPNLANREHLYKVPIRALIHAGGDVNAFNAVRVVAGVVNDSSRTAAGTGDAKVIFRECQLSALLIRSART
jgi:hypothetical protein